MKNAPNSKIVFLEGPEACGKTSLLNSLQQEFKARNKPVYSFIFSDYYDAARIKAIFLKAGNDRQFLEEAIIAVFDYFEYVSKTVLQFNAESETEKIFLIDSYVWRTFVLQGYLNDQCDLFYRLFNLAKQKGQMQILDNNDFQKFLFVLDAKEKKITERHIQRLKTNTAEALDEFFMVKLTDVKEGYRICMRNQNTSLALSDRCETHFIDGSGSIAWANYQAIQILGE